MEELRDLERYLRCLADSGKSGLAHRFFRLALRKAFWTFTSQEVEFVDAEDIMNMGRRIFPTGIEVDIALCLTFDGEPVPTFATAVR